MGKKNSDVPSPRRLRLQLIMTSTVDYGTMPNPIISSTCPNPLPVPTAPHSPAELRLITLTTGALTTLKRSTDPNLRRISGESTLPKKGALSFRSPTNLCLIATCRHFYLE